MSEMRVISGAFTDEERLHAALSSTLRSNGASPEAAIALLGKVAREQTWRHLRRGVSGAPFWSFTDYVEASTFEGGLGLNDEDVKALVHIRTEVERRAAASDRARELAQYRADVLRTLLSDIDAAAGHGGARAKQERATLLNHNDTATGITARLKRDDPELADAVIRGEVTPNAAARAKGWRFPRVELRNPVTVAARIRATFTPEQIEKLVNELTQKEA